MRCTFTEYRHMQRWRFILALSRSLSVTDASLVTHAVIDAYIFTGDTRSLKRFTGDTGMSQTLISSQVTHAVLDAYIFTGDTRSHRRLYLHR